MTQLPDSLRFAARLLILSAGVACGSPATVIGDSNASHDVVYISTNTGPIHVLALDLTSGELAETSRHDGGINPTYMAFSPDKHFAFAINEADPPDSKVRSFAIDETDGRLTPIDSVVTGAAGSAHLAVHPSGKWLALPHYGRESNNWVGGETMIVPIESDGSFGEVGPSQRGPSDRPCVNAHQAVFTSFGRYILVPCLGSNYVLQLRFDDGELLTNSRAIAELDEGSDPRHIALSPDQRHAYLLTERTSQIVWFDYDPTRGLLSKAGSVQSTREPIPEGGNGWSGHVVVHPSGKFLFVSNRKGLQDNGEEHGSENSLGVFELAANGEPTPISDGFVSEGIDTPRDFAVDPGGRYLISANQAGDQSAHVFRIDRRSGRLTPTSVFSLGDSPAFVHVLGSRAESHL